MGDWKNNKANSKDFQKETIKVFKAVEPGDKGTELAVVRWIVDGRAAAPQLVNQELYFDKIDKKMKYGKMKGLKFSDLVVIENNLETIKDLLEDVGSREPRPKRDTSAMAANDDPFASGKDEVPF